jgi:hypothetical protein
MGLDHRTAVECRCGGGDQKEVAMPRYKLLAQHYSEEDKLLEADEIVGDGTPHLWTRRPTPQMEALDEAGRQAIEKEMVRAKENKITWTPGVISPIDDLPLTIEATDEKYEKEVEEAAADTDRMAGRERTPAGQVVARTTLADRARR